MASSEADRAVQPAIRPESSRACSTSAWAELVDTPAMAHAVATAALPAAFVHVEYCCSTSDQSLLTSWLAVRPNAPTACSPMIEATRWLGRWLMATFMVSSLPAVILVRSRAPALDSTWRTAALVRTCRLVRRSRSMSVSLRDRRSAVCGPALEVTADGLGLDSAGGVTDTGAPGAGGPSAVGGARAD